MTVWNNLDNSSPILFSDVSEFRPAIPDMSYSPYGLFLRSGSGNYLDASFRAQYYAALELLACEKLDFLGVYHFFWNGCDNAGTFNRALDSIGGVLHPKTILAVDVEDAGGQIVGNHSDEINAFIEHLRSKVGNPKRVGAYINENVNGVNSANSLWSNRIDMPWYWIPDYGATPGAPRVSNDGMIFHQFASDYVQSPFGASDMNVFMGTMPELLDRVGLRDINTGAYVGNGSVCN